VKNDGDLAGHPLSFHAVRLATYNIKHASLKGLPAVAAALAPLQADLVALQEVDIRVDRSGRVDQARELGRLLGLQPVFARAFDLEGGNYGVALLTRWPAIAERVTLLPSASDVPRPDGVEPRVLLEVDLATPAGAMTVAVTHLGLSSAERLEQAGAILAHLQRPRAVLVGDLNEGPGEPAFERLASYFRDALAALPDRRTFPAEAPQLAIDHVLVSPDLPLPAAVRRVPADASDHLPVVVEFVVPLRP
jgi:endonuclease/exonuclease/phosphatase family metal-dependent hydrolase